MTRNRSREAETEDVNQRRLRRGAVKRQHIGRWAVGATELAPGIVGNIHLHPSTLERIREVAVGAGVGQLLVRSITDQSFADGGDYVDADVTVYQHGFDGVASFTDEVVWPIDAVGEIQVEMIWDTYQGGGTIEIEVDGAIPAWGLLASGTSGQRGCKRRSVHISEGAVVRVKVTQDSGDPQTGSVHVEYSIPDPSLDVTLPPPPPGPAELFPKIWFKGETLAGLLSDGDPLTVWPDISGNGYDAFPVAGHAPVYRAGVLNSLGVVEFDGVNDGMVTATGNLTLQGNAPDVTRVGEEWTIFAVFATDNASASQEVVNGDDQTNSPGADRGSQYIVIQSATTYTSPSSAVNDFSGQTVVSGTWHVGEAWRSTTEAEALLDGAGNGPTSIASLTGHFESANNIYLGMHVAASGWFDGKIAEVIGWGRRLDAAERTLVRDYFNDEYGL